jgi:adenylosuccinate synthase
MAGRAAQRAELDMLTDLRSAIESNTLPPRVSSTIARSAMGGSRYGRMERSARRAVKTGDLARAQNIAKSYQSRLVEAQKTVNAAKVAGAKLPSDIQTRAKLYSQRLKDINTYINKTYYKQQKQKAKAKQ